MKICILVPVLLVLGGCAHFEDRPIDPQSNLSAFEARSLADPGLLAFMQETRPDVDFSTGWTAADLTLAAFYFQPELAVARVRWAAARSGIDQAGEFPNPTLGIAPAFNSSTPSGSGISPWIVGATLDIPVDYSGKRKARVAEAHAMARAVWLQVIQTAWETRTKVRAELMMIHAARQQSTLQQQQVDLLEAHLKQLEKQHHLGVIMQLEVRKARQDLAVARKNAIEAEKQEALAVARLASVVGLPAHALKTVSFNISEFNAMPEPPASSTLWQQALLNRADILGKLAEYEASQFRLQLEIAKQYPDLTIGPGYEFDQGAHKWGLGISLELPIFNRNQAAIETARLKREQAEAEFNALQARVIGGLNEAMADYAHSLRQFRASQEIEHGSEQRLQMLEQQASFGAISRNKMISDQLNLYEAKWQELAARTEALAALGRLENELQSPADLPSWQAALEQTIDQNEDIHETR